MVAESVAGDCDPGEPGGGGGDRAGGDGAEDGEPGHLQTQPRPLHQGDDHHGKKSFWCEYSPNSPLVVLWVVL